MELLERFGVPAWICDRESLRVLAVNQAAVETYGYAREEFLRLTQHDIQARSSPLLTDRDRTRHRRSDGTELDVEQVACALDLGGCPAVLVLRAAHPVPEETTDWEALVLQLAELVPHYAFRVEPDGTMRGEWLSRSFERAFGFTREEIDARGGWTSMVHPEDVPVALEHARRVLEGSRDVCEVRFVSRGGEVRWIRDTAVPVWDRERRKVVRIYGAVQDITELKEAERQRWNERSGSEGLRTRLPPLSLSTRASGSST
ncbi:MAG: PAS domain-containing protein [Chloroflexia bacterium]